MTVKPLSKSENALCVNAAAPKGSDKSGKQVLDAKHDNNVDQCKIEHMFKPLTVGSQAVSNRFFMAPLTRCRADPNTYIPNEMMTEYYGQRARSAGLIIAEFASVSENAVTFHTEPGIYNDQQAEAWKQVTQEVHKHGGRIFCQIAHGGRAAHPLNNGGKIPVAPSAIGLTHRCGEHFNPTGKQVDNVTPRELTDEEIPLLVQDFITAARRAIDAGFDGVEIHGANGYLINQFSCAASNKRASGPYCGNTMETRHKFLFDIVRGVVEEIGSDKVGVRISPLGTYQDMHEEDPIAVTRYVAEQCNDLGIAYLHVIRGDTIKTITGKEVDVISPAREAFRNILIVNMGYSEEEAEEGVKSGKFDAVAFGTKFLANPDYPDRVKNDAEMNPPDYSTFYTKTSKGYNDYPLMKV